MEGGFFPQLLLNNTIKQHSSDQGAAIVHLPLLDPNSWSLEHKRFYSRLGKQLVNKAKE